MHIVSHALERAGGGDGAKQIDSEQIHEYAIKNKISLFRGAGEYSGEWHRRMQDQAWKDNKGQPVKDWKKLAASWASERDRVNQPKKNINENRN
jgi:hypothetical protein